MQTEKTNEDTKSIKGDDLSENKNVFPKRSFKKSKISRSLLEGIEEEVVSTNRISKTTKGGKRLRFNAAIVLGDKKGRVGYGTGKAREIQDAIRKARRTAHTNMIQVKLVGGAATIPHTVNGKAAATRVQLRPARSGKGIVAGGAVRIIMQLAGIENVSAKIHGSKNKLNAIRATFDALEKLELRAEVMARRNWRDYDEKPAPLAPWIWTFAFPKRSPKNDMKKRWTNKSQVTTIIDKPKSKVNKKDN